MFLQTISPTIPFTRRCFYTQTLWHTHTTLSHKRFYAHTLLHTSTFTQTLLHIGPFTHTHTHTPLSHTHKHVYLAMLPMECHFEPLFGWVMLLQPKKECHGILHAEKQSASLFCRHRFKMSTLCTSKSQTDPIDLFCATSCPHAANW